MKFESKAHMAQELITGKRFTYNGFGVIFFDEQEKYPFRYEEEVLLSFWGEFDKDVWDEVTPRHIHQDLIDSYLDGQAWQFSQDNGASWEDCYGKYSGWDTPSWHTDTKYRFHPHNDLIQAFNSGAEIEYFEDSINRWLPEMSPTWSENVKYRIKPKTKTVYEWMLRSIKGELTISGKLMTEDEIKVFAGRRDYQKTGRSFEVTA